MRAQRSVLVALASVGLLLAGCGTEGEQEAGETADGAATTGDGGPAAVDGLGVGETYTVLGALAELPPTSEDTVMVQTADVAAATDLAGLERPTDVGDADAVTRWFNPLTGATPEGGEPSPVFVPIPSFVEPGAQVEEFDELAGWSLLDVDSYADLATLPDWFTVVSGELAEDTLHHLPEVGEGVRTVGEGEDFHVELTRSSAVSRIGQPVRMAQADGRLAMGPATPTVQRWLTGSGDSLADDAQLAALAEALDGHGVVSAMLYAGEPGAFAHLGMPSASGETADVDFLPDVPFTATAVAWTVEDDRPRMVVAWSYPSPAVAEEALADLEGMFEEGRSLTQGTPLTDWVDLVEVTTQGPVAVATLDAVDPQAPHRLPHLLNSRDVPFVHQ